VWRRGDRPAGAARRSAPPAEHVHSGTGSGEQAGEEIGAGVVVRRERGALASASLTDEACLGGPAEVLRVPFDCE
jgi:hypothetical protein